MGQPGPWISDKTRFQTNCHNDVLEDKKRIRFVLRSIRGRDLLYKLYFLRLNILRLAHFPIERHPDTRTWATRTETRNELKR